jgi:hypothetical protein
VLQGKGAPQFGEVQELELPTGQESFIYRLWNSAGECLYVGKTIQLHPLCRVAEHQKQEWWSEVARADYVSVVGDLSLAEAKQIKDLNPKYNVVRPSYDVDLVIRALNGETTAADLDWLGMSAMGKK